MAQPCGPRPIRRCYRIVPNTLGSWRVAKPLLRTTAPHAGQGGQAAGALIEDHCDQLDGHDPGHLPRRQDQRREGVGVWFGVQFDWTPDWV
jgi:hypothetical protein